MWITRRTLLRYGLVGSVLLAGGALLSTRPTLLRAPGGRLLALDERSFSVLAAVADRVAPGGGAFPSATRIRVAEKVDALLATGDPAQAAEVRQVLLLLDNALVGLLLEGRPRTFTSLDPEAQDRVLIAWRDSRLALRRTAYKALVGLCSAAYYASEEVWPAIGYPGPPDFGQGRAE